ncbi:MAG: trypsin-like peptidase domain-containing protein [Candidatus Solibacter usitatus]|nr:trypsin-like peptidase domain-containing protein [Candidatus Solibacter usitatus]
MRTNRILLALLFTAAAWAQPAAEGRLYTPPAKAARKTARVELPSALAMAAAPRRVELPTLEEQPMRANAHGQVPVGTTRRLDGEAAGAWETLPDARRIWRVALRSPGAAALRVHFRGFAVGKGKVWIYSPADPSVDGVYTGSGTYEDGDFWSGTVSGDTLIVEYLPDAAQPGDDSLPFQIDAVGHVWTAMEQPQESNVPMVAPCQLDFKCYSQWAQIGSGVAQMVFLNDADKNFYVCTGALVNTRNSSLAPYFLTANHCIGTDSEARSLQTYWFYETAQCNGAAVTRSVATRIDGARLLATAPMAEGDYSLLRLNALPAATVWFAGWDPTDPPFGASLTGIHHPGGSYKRISFGQRAADTTANVGGEVAPANKFYRVRENQGRIEGGSSGSPLYIDNGRIVGTLTYGPMNPPNGTACDIANFEAGYGRFSAAFPALRQYLEDQAAPPPAATVTVTPQSLAFRLVNGAVQAPAAQSLRIETTSTTALSFTLAANAAWVRLSIASGSVVAGTPVLVDVTVDATALRTAGSFAASIALTAGTAAPQSIGVRADVTAAGSVVAGRVDPDPVYQQAPDADGYSWFFTVRLAESAGIETRLTQFRVDGTDYSAQIPAWFGTDRIAASGSLNAVLRANWTTVPKTSVFEFAGADPGTGRTWSLQISPRFLGPRNQASLTLTVTPNPVVRDPASVSCAWRHDVAITEGSGVGVTLNRWLAGGYDLSSNIAGWFQRTRLDPSGTLRTTLCWRTVPAPTTLAFEIGGRDDQGNTVKATASARFVDTAAQALPEAEWRTDSTPAGPMIDADRR